MMTCTDQNQRLPYSHLILRNLILPKIKIAKLNNQTYVCERDNKTSSSGSIQQHGSIMWTEEETLYHV